MCYASQSLGLPAQQPSLPALGAGATCSKQVAVGFWAAGPQWSRCGVPRRLLGTPTRILLAGRVMAAWAAFATSVPLALRSVAPGLASCPLEAGPFLCRGHANTSTPPNPPFPGGAFRSPISLAPFFFRPRQTRTPINQQRKKEAKKERGASLKASPPFF